MMGNHHPATGLNEVVFCFLDVETTGLYPRSGDRICEVALLRWKGGKSLSTFHSLVNPGHPISPGAFAINGITEAMVKDAPKFGEIALRILSFVQDSVIVAHNAPFDLGFLATQLIDLRLPLPGNLVLCTLVMARRCFCFPNNSLGSIARHLGYGGEGRHRAREDVELTKEIFSYFLQHFRRQGIGSLEELLELQGGSIPFPRVAEVVLPPVLDEALRRRKPVRFRYVSSSQEETSRVVDPIEIMVAGDCIYLVAFCHLRQEQRTFRLDRVGEIQLME